MNEAREVIGSLPLAEAAQFLKLRRALKSYAIKTKAEISPTQSHFNNYSNAVSISNIKLKGYNGLSYLKYEYNRFYNYLNGNPGMSMIVVANVGFKHYEDENDEPSIFNEVRSRRYNITNVGELMTVMNQMSSDIKLTIENAQLEKSGLHIHSINRLTVMYTIYDPTRAGTYIKLPKFINDKNHVLTLKI